MTSLRVAWRACALLAVTLAYFALWRVGVLFVGARSDRGRRLRRRWMGRWARAVVRVIGARVEVQGPVPPAPCVLVSNHLGYVDIPVLASCTELVFVSKIEVRQWPLIGPAAAAIGTIFLDRSSRRAIPGVNAQISESLAASDRVLFFPEGTSTSGEQVLPFKSSLLEPAAQSGYPVFCAAVHYSTPSGEVPASQSVCWWGDMEFTPHIFGLLRLSGFRARVVFHAEPHVGQGRKQLAERTEQAVVELHRDLHRGLTAT
ncbi:MAG: 1-acyl-sn-glycerol-3-phosphate acyltransferase [Planctomycetes bacterium]|nr:1-acyl-sn-glycerol-3-phosphate acyltransferase [Planctomycetota bacterium]